MARTRHRTLESNIPLRDLPASALRAVFREGYGRAEFKQDVLSGAVVGLIALPLAMALAIAVGVPPQAGLYTAVIAGFVVAALGGSRTQVTGPTAAFIVILAPIYTKFGMAGLLLSGLLGGLTLVMMGLLRLGRLIQFVPYPVTTGFTAGIATVIAVMQTKDLLGLTIQGDPAHFLEKVVEIAGAMSTLRLPEASIGLFTLGLLVVIPRWTKKVPAPLVALPIAAGAAHLVAMGSPGWQVDTISSRFHTIVDGVQVNGIPQILPHAVLPWNAPGPQGEPLALDYDTFRAIFVASLAVAMLGAIESLLSAVVADGMARTKHDPDSELIAQGLGNLVVPFFGGIAATGAIARTATNVKAGARSPLASMTHAVTILAAILLLSPLLGYLPMASLAALLLVVAWNMSEARHLVHVLRVAPKSDVAVLLTCFSLTVAFDMVVGVSVGMVLAALLFMRRMAEVTEMRAARIEQSSPDLLIPTGVSVYEISGPLFFGAAQRAMTTLEIVGESSRAVIIVMSRVNAIDATGLVAFESAVQTLFSHGCPIILTDVQRQPRDVLRRAHFEKDRNLHYCADLKEALALAEREMRSRADGNPKGAVPPGPPALHPG